MPQPVLVFVSYSHRDERLREALDGHLSLLHREGVIDGWHDRRIAPGEDWATAIDSALNEAELVIFLVSSDFLASDYCWGVEMALAMERHRTGRATVIPVVVRPVDWQTSPLGQFQALPTDAKPITKWRNRDEAWTQVARGIRTIAKRLRPEQAEPPYPLHDKTSRKATIRVAVVGAAHVGAAAAEDRHRTAFTEIGELIATARLQADLLLSTGDLAWRGDPASTALAWSRLDQYRQELGASALVGTLGNHDLSRTGVMQISRPPVEDFRPSFPTPDPQSSGAYIDGGFAVHGGAATVVTLDSTAWFARGFQPDRLEVPPQLSGEVSARLAHTRAGEPKVILCHHSPLEADGGTELLARLVDTHPGPWFVVYGHEHREARLVRAISLGASATPVSLVAVGGSGVPSLGWYPGPQFAVVDLPLPSAAGACAPSVVQTRAWEWLHGFGWRLSARST